MRKELDPLGRQELVKEHGQLPHQVEHQHDTNSHEQDACTDFNNPDVFTELVECNQKMMKKQPGDNIKKKWLFSDAPAGGMPKQVPTGFQSRSA